jgi:tight adherence protein C
MLGVGGAGLFVLALRGWVLLRTVPGLAVDAGEPAGAGGRAGTAGAKRRRRGMSFLLGLVGRRAGPYFYRMLSPRRREKIQRRIVTAGRPGGLDIHSYCERKSAQLLLYGAAAVLFLALGVWITAAIALAFGLIAEDIKLSRASRLRRDEIDRSLPDFLDVLAVVVSAGLSFRQGLARVADTLGGPLADEVRATLRQMDLGVSRREALIDLRERAGSERLGQFVTALLQAEELGAPLAATLLELSGDQRREAAQETRRRAARAAPRVSLVVSMVIVPGTMIIIVAGLYYGTALSEHGLFPQ